MGKEGIDFITCLICGNQLRRLDGGHIQRKHDMTPNEYRGRFPGAQLSCDGYRQNIKQSVEKLWEDGRYNHISSIVKNLWDTGHYDNHSQKVLAAYERGAYQHIYTKERNKKISEAQKGIPKSEECKANIARAHADGKYKGAPAKISKSVSRRWDEGNYSHVDWQKVQTKPETLKKKREASKAAHSRGCYVHVYDDPKVKQKTT